jgi:aspartate/methionine/tyrosine aminotransferase
MGPIRDEIEALQQNGITGVAMPRWPDPKVIPLWFGEGDMPTPAFIRDAAKRALDAGDTFYVNTRGRQELRDAIKTYLDDLYRIDVHPDRITVPGSAMLGVTIAAQLALTSGDHGLIVSPHWPNIETVFRVTGARVSHVRQRETAEGWMLSAAEIIAAVEPETRCIYLNSPCNPTGWVMTRDEQLLLLAFCRQRGILLLADEVYHRTVYDADAAPSFLSIAQDDDPLVVVNGFSKAWAMTGWRIGWMVAPKRLVVQMAALSECFSTGATVFAQAGAIAALEGGDPTVRELRAQYQRGRQITLDILSQEPAIRLTPPVGAFYAFPRIKGLNASRLFAEQLLEKYDVGVAPGYTFGPDNDGHIRICFAQSHERLAEGLHRLIAFVREQDFSQ